MEMTFKDLKLAILRALDDEPDENAAPLAGGSYSALLLQDAVYAALNAVTQRIWRQQIVDIAAAATNAELPADTLDVSAIYESKLGVFIPRISFQIGNAMHSAAGNGWYLYPTGYVTFLNAIGSNGARMFYSAHWTKPEKDSDLIDAPEITRLCLVLFSASYCLFPSAVSSGDIRQFNTKGDSGQPENNPAKQLSEMFLRRFEEELKRIPMMEKGRTQ